MMVVAVDQACGRFIVGASSTAEALSEGKSNCSFAGPAPAGTPAQPLISRARPLGGMPE